MECSIWHHDDDLGWYFILVNPILVICYFMSGLGIFVIDVMILVMISQLTNKITHDDGKMEGESLLQLVNQAEEDIAVRRERAAARERGKRFNEFLQLKLKKRSGQNARSVGAGMD